MKVRYFPCNSVDFNPFNNGNCAFNRFCAILISESSLPIIISSISLLDNFCLLPGGWLPVSVISDSSVSDVDNSSLI